MGDHRAARTRTENEWTTGNYLSSCAFERDVLRDENGLWLGMAATRLPELQNRLPLLSLMALVGNLGGDPHSTARSGTAWFGTQARAECGDH